MSMSLLAAAFQRMAEQGGEGISKASLYEKEANKALEKKGEAICMSHWVILGLVGLSHENHTWLNLRVGSTEGICRYQISKVVLSDGGLPIQRMQIC